MLTIAIAMRSVSGFPVFADPRIFELTPLLRFDCTNSDECCMRITRRYFDMLPFNAWDRAGLYPVYSTVVPNKGLTELTLLNVRNHNRLADTDICRFRCRDGTLNRSRPKNHRIQLWKTFSFKCPEGLSMVYYQETLRIWLEPPSTWLKCKCIITTSSVELQPRPVIEKLAEARAKSFVPPLASKTRREQSTVMTIGEGESDCFDIDFAINPPQSLDQMFLDILATTLPDIEPKRESSNRPHHDADTLSIPWTEILDVTQQEVAYQPGPTVYLQGADPAHHYRACAEAPTIAAARLLAQSFWTPI